MNEDILRLAGILNEDHGFGPESRANAEARQKQHETFAFATGMYRATSRMVRNTLETALRQLDNEEWNREQDSRIMLEHLERAARHALEDMNRTEKKINELELPRS